MTSTKQARRAREEYSKVLPIPRLSAGKNLNQKGYLIGCMRTEEDAKKWAKVFSGYFVASETTVGYDLYGEV